MTSRELIFILAVFSLGTSSLLKAQSALKEKSKPNILWVMADDLRPQLGCYGDKVVQSPALDKFAEHALRFDLAYVQYAACSPSRNSMFSGMRPNTTGLRGFGTSLREAIPDVITLPQHFKNNGYDARGFGKIYHIYAESMLGDEDDPKSWSKPLKLPTVPVWGPKQNELRNKLIEEARLKGKKFNHPHDWPRAETWDDSDIPDDEMQDGNTTAMAETYLESRKGKQKPFFLAVGFLRPHLPFNAPKKYWDLYDPKEIPIPAFSRIPEGSYPWTVSQNIVANYHNMPAFKDMTTAYKRRYIQAYLACISYVDACFNRLLRALESSGHADNTIIVFMGDHGYQMGEYNSWGHKQTNFEISTRTPLIIRVPGMTQAGKATVQITEFLDLYPTMCELAGLEKPDHLEGKSFHALFQSEAVDKNRVAFSEKNRRGRLGRAIRTQDFRYIEWRNKHNKLVGAELYDHRGDKSPGMLETVNVIEDKSLAPEVKVLSQRLRQALPH